MDFMVTLLGVIWIILNYTFNDHVIVILGYVVILLRFCTITGKQFHSYGNVPLKAHQKKGSFRLLYKIKLSLIFRKTLDPHYADPDCHHVYLQKFLHYHVDVPHDHLLCISWQHSVW